jgi:hypothetical protein
MQLFGFLLAACIVLTLIRYAMAALFVAFIAMLLWGALTRPRETFGFVSLCLLSSIAKAHPALCIVGLGLAAIIVAAEPTR